MQPYRNKFLLTELHETEEHHLELVITLDTGITPKIEINKIKHWIEGVYLEIDADATILTRYEVQEDKILVFLDSMFIEESAKVSYYTFSIIIELCIQGQYFEHYVLLAEQEESMIEINERTYYLAEKQIGEYYFSLEKCSTKETERYVLKQLEEKEDSIELVLEGPEIRNRIQFELVSRDKNRRMSFTAPIQKKGEGLFVVSIEKAQMSTLARYENKKKRWDCYIRPNRIGVSSPIYFSSNPLIFYEIAKKETVLRCYKNRRGILAIHCEDAIACKIEEINNEEESVQVIISVCKDIPYINNLEGLALCSIDKTVAPYINIPAKRFKEDANAVYYEIKIELEAYRIAESMLGVLQPKFVVAYQEGRTITLPIKVNQAFLQFDKEPIFYLGVLRNQNFLYSLIWYVNVEGTLKCFLQRYLQQGYIHGIMQTHGELRILGTIVEKGKNAVYKKAYLLDREGHKQQLNCCIDKENGIITYQLSISIEKIGTLPEGKYGVYVSGEWGDALLCEERMIEKAMYKGFCEKWEDVLENGLYVGSYQFFYEHGFLGLRIKKNRGFLIDNITEDIHGYEIVIRPKAGVPAHIELELNDTKTGSVEKIPCEIRNEQLYAVITLKQLEKMKLGEWKMQLSYKEKEVNYHMDLYTEAVLEEERLKVSREVCAVISTENEPKLCIRPIFRSEKPKELLLNELAIWWAAITKRNHKIWLIGESENNTKERPGFEFFRYCMEHELEEEVYYIVDSENRNKEYFLRYKEHVVFANSFTHLVLYAASHVLVVNVYLKEVIPEVCKNEKERKRKQTIYLQCVDYKDEMACEEVLFLIKKGQRRKEGKQNADTIPDL